MNSEPTMSDTPEFSQFDDLLNAEISRMSDANVAEKPFSSTPLSLEEYSQAVAPISQVREEQVEAFKADARRYFEEIQDEQGGRFSQTLHSIGAKVVPVLMPHEHGYPQFNEERIHNFGNLYFYVLTRDNLTVRPDKLAYMDAVLPPEIIDLGVPLPPNLRDETQRQNFFAEFDGAVDKLLKMMRGSLN